MNINPYDFLERTCGSYHITYDPKTKCAIFAMCPKRTIIYKEAKKLFQGMRCENPKEGLLIFLSVTT